MVMDKALSIKVNIYSLFYGIIFLLPFIQTELRIRIGAGWQLYIPLIFILYFFVLVKNKEINNLYYFVNTLFFFMLASNIYGFIFYMDSVLSVDLLMQIKSVEAVMIVESIRWLSCIIFFGLTLYLVNTVDRYIKAVTVFLYTVLFQALYGIYEFLVKSFLKFLPLLNEKAYSHESFRVFGTFFEPSQYGLFMLIGILFFIWYVSIASKLDIPQNIFTFHKKKILLLFTFAFLLSLSRAAFLVGIVIALFSFLFSIFSLKKFFKFLSFVILFVILFSLYINLTMDDKIFEAWIYLLTADSGNGLIARIYRTVDDFYEIIVFGFSNFLGTGQGSAIIFEQGMVPFFFRFFIENGVFIYTAYILFILSIVIRIFNTYARDIKINSLIVLIALILIQFNYNSTTDPWIWFGFIMLFKIRLLKYKVN